MSDAADTLFLPFEKGILDFSGKTLFLYAYPHACLGRFEDIAFQTPYKFDAAALTGKMHEKETAGETAGEIAGEFDTALVLCPKQKEETLYALAKAYGALKAGGILVCSAANDAGGNRLEGFLSAAGLKSHSLSKNKARVVWAQKTGAESKGLLASWVEGGAVQPILSGAYHSQPGLFGWDKEDTGSSLLLRSLPVLSGKGADFGCGWGYLSAQCLVRNPDIQSLYAIDADSRALTCTAANAKDSRLHVIWHDLRVKLPLEKLDFIIMNPPFHTGKATDQDLGLAFIANASLCLKSGGALYMVANRHLAYEQSLSTRFSGFEILAQEQGFKIIKALK